MSWRFWERPSPWDDVQALLLRPSTAGAVLHVILRVTPGRGGEALQALKATLGKYPLTAGNGRPSDGVHCTLGFTYRGLQALGLPPSYLGLFSRLAPAFRDGAPLRAAQLGDTGPNAASRWQPGFGIDEAHVLLTLHGQRDRLDQAVHDCLARHGEGAALVCRRTCHGERLGAPPGKVGEWVHFGFRDGLVEHRIEGVRRSEPHRETEVVRHAPGEILLGHANDRGANPFALERAPAEVRGFFRSSSFGVLRPVAQDVRAFEKAVRQWKKDAEAMLPQRPVSTDWVKAKLCGRWPTGEAVRPGQTHPDEKGPDAFRLDFARDPEGTGCPWTAHVRRMDARGHAAGVQRQRMLLRRGMPYGPADWTGQAEAGDRGLLALFFCASIEDQFELLLSQWANGPPPGRPDSDAAADPIAGRHADGEAAAAVPLPDGRTLQLTGFGPWTRTLGTMYTWHPAQDAVRRILAQEYAKKEDGPWL